MKTVLVVFGIAFAVSMLIVGIELVAAERRDRKLRFQEDPDEEAPLSARARADKLWHRGAANGG